MNSNYIIKRNIATFNFTLIYDGRSVKLFDKEKVLYEKKCRGVRDAGKLMREMENSLYETCEGMLC